MTRTWSFYDPATGEFIGRTFAGPDTALAINTPRGMVAFEGDHDHRTMRVNLGTGALERWRDPPPSRDHQWQAGQWVRSRVAARREALAQIVALEAQQLRPLRELAVDPDNPIARERLTSLDAQIAELRELL